jgi:hypothetical protein
VPLGRERIVLEQIIPQVKAMKTKRRSGE